MQDKRCLKSWILFHFDHDLWASKERKEVKDNTDSASQAGVSRIHVLVNSDREKFQCL